MDKDKAYILHILDAMEEITTFVGDHTFDTLLEDTKTIRSVERNLEIIGEAVKNMSDKIKNVHPEINWKNIAGSRDIIAHHYFDLDYQIIWDVIQIDLPELKNILEKYK